MSHVAIGYEDFSRFQQTTKGITKKLISIMRGRDVDEKFIDDMLEWLNKLKYLITTVDHELQNSMINDVSVVRCVFAKLAVFGEMGEFSSHLFNIISLIQENNVKKTRISVRYLISMIEMLY
jgi:hypothetical protein